MKTSVLDDLKSISVRHRELHPNSVADPKPASETKAEPRDWFYKPEAARFLVSSSMYPDLVLTYKGKTYRHKSDGWYETQET